VKTIAYICVTSNKQATESQREDILGYTHKHTISVDEYAEIELSGKKSIDQKNIHGLLDRLNTGDTFITSELSSLGRSSAQVITIVNALVEKKVRFIAVKQSIDIHTEQDTTSRVMACMFGLFAQLERDLVSRRTKQGLAERRAAGVRLGRPKGSTGKSKLDPHKEQIALMLKHKAPLSYIARVYNVTWPTVSHFIKTRKLDQSLNSRNYPGG